jgi:ribosomal protein S18 acetylase RimI-like enzyme
VIERGGAELLGELEPLWLALVDHHHEIAPHLGPIREPADSWARRRAEYARWLEQQGSFVLVARDEDGRAVGYAMVVAHDGSPTWRSPERAGEVETLSLLPAARGRGLGRALLDRAQEELRAAGIDELRLSVIATNERAVRFYEREGFAPMVTYMRRTR